MPTNLLTWLRRKAGTFREEAHPRADDGKFGEVSGGKEEGAKEGNESEKQSARKVPKKPRKDQIDEGTIRDGVRTWISAGGRFFYGDLELKLIPVDKIIATEEIESPKMVELARSGFESGKQIPPIMVDRFGKVADGHHRLEGAKQAGMTHIWALRQKPKQRPGKDQTKRLFAMLRRKAGFNEQDHPRADDGKFGSGGGGSAKPKESSKPAAQKPKESASKDSPEKAALKNNVREELTARGPGNLMAIATLVEDHGPGIKEALMDMWRAGEVQLVPSSLLSTTAKQYGYSVEDLQKLSIHGAKTGAGNELITEVGLPTKTPKFSPSEPAKPDDKKPSSNTPHPALQQHLRDHQAATDTIHERAAKDPSLTYEDIRAHVDSLASLPKTKLKEIAASVHVTAPSGATKEWLLKQIHESIANRKGRQDRTREYVESKQSPKPSAIMQASPADFGKEVQAVAGQTSTGGFGTNKVFISHVYREFAKKNPGVTLDQFKDKLNEAATAGSITLGRADMVQVMDEDDVKQSQLERLPGMRGYEAHFILSDHPNRQRSKPKEQGKHLKRLARLLRKGDWKEGLHPRAENPKLHKRLRRLLTKRPH